MGRSCSGRRLSTRIGRDHSNAKCKCKCKRSAEALHFAFGSTCPLLTDERRVSRQRPPDVDVAGDGVHFLAVDENLDALHGGEVGGDGVDDRVDRQEFGERTARDAPPRSRGSGRRMRRPDPVT